MRKMLSIPFARFLKTNVFFLLISVLVLPGLRSSHQNESYTHLMSYDNSSLRKKDGVYEFHGETCITIKNDFVPIKRKIDNHLPKISIDAVCISDLGILTIDVSSDQTAAKRINGFPLLKSDGTYDVSLDFGHGTIFASEILVADSLTCIENLVIDKETTTLYPIASISLSLATYASATSLAFSYVKVPNLFVDGPTEYAMYEAKLAIAAAHYAANKKNKNPTSILEVQSNLSDWHFGIGNNLAKNGCGVIAIFNFLFDSGAKPNLAILIAITELCNADLLWGIFGVNPIPDELFKAASALIEKGFDCFIMPIMMKLIPTLSVTIIGFCSTIVPAWLIPLLGPACAITMDTIIASLSAILLSASVFVKEIMPWYVRNMHDIKDVLNLICANNFSSHPVLGSFGKRMHERRQGVVSFWNKIDKNGMIDVLGGAHTVYIRKEVDGFYCANNNKVNIPSQSVYEIIDSNEKNANKKFIWGYIVDAQ